MDSLEIIQFKNKDAYYHYVYNEIITFGNKTRWVGKGYIIINNTFYTYLNITIKNYEEMGGLAYLTFMDNLSFTKEEIIDAFKCFTSDNNHWHKRVFDNDIFDTRIYELKPSCLIKSNFIYKR